MFNMDVHGVVIWTTPSNLKNAHQIVNASLNVFVRPRNGQQHQVLLQRIHYSCVSLTKSPPKMELHQQHVIDRLTVIIFSYLDLAQQQRCRHAAIGVYLIFPSSPLNPKPDTEQKVKVQAQGLSIGTTKHKSMIFRRHWVVPLLSFVKIFCLAKKVLPLSWQASSIFFVYWR